MALPPKPCLMDVWSLLHYTSGHYVEVWAVLLLLLLDFCSCLS